MLVGIFRAQLSAERRAFSSLCAGVSLRRFCHRLALFLCQRLFHDTGIARQHRQQNAGGALWRPTALFPIA